MLAFKHGDNKKRCCRTKNSTFQCDHSCSSDRGNSSLLWVKLHFLWLKAGWLNFYLTSWMLLSKLKGTMLPAKTLWAPTLVIVFERGLHSKAAGRHLLGGNKQTDFLFRIKSNGLRWSLSRTVILWEELGKWLMVLHIPAWLWQSQQELFWWRKGWWYKASN